MVHRPLRHAISANIASVPLFLALLLVVEIGGGFGGATVGGTETTATTMEIDLSVALPGSAGPVLAHLVLPGETRTVPLVDRGRGTWGVLVEVRRADWAVVFEDVITGELSDALSLTRLGLDPALLGGLPSAAPTGERDDAATTPMAWGWLAAAVLAGGGAVALAFVGRRKPRHLRRRRRSRRTRWQGRPAGHL